MYCDKYYAYLLAQDYNKLEAERDRLAEELEEAKAEIDGYKQYNQAVRHANEELAPRMSGCGGSWRGSGKTNNA
jgi:uncharacterized membrane protein